ncbi:hypothetical protein T4E_8089 [Trichinella pseudospiralis]|nr:hypothetical protein T4E_8089 [Trichinella pseudospiralis]
MISAQSEPLPNKVRSEELSEVDDAQQSSSISSLSTTVFCLHKRSQVRLQGRVFAIELLL